ncbi:MAG: YHS domain-containing (seleno)protein [Spirochaetia bacterium]|jgi:YHS domain-containing protein|nr:YHS domain-containing (seleno)protein [Spirochaetia bacterium]
MHKGLKIYNKRKAGLISQDIDGIAVKGYDMVALKVNVKLEKGTVEHSLMLNEVTWLFSSKENMVLFVKDPQKYMPEFGGYCAWSVANDSELPPSPGDPSAYDIVDGKMYFKFNKMVRFLWRISRAKYIKKGNDRWPQFVNAITEYLKTNA